MMNARKTLTLTIMCSDYRLAVAHEEEAYLRDCAELVLSKMQEIHQPGKVFSPDSVAVLAALRIAYENLIQRQAVEEMNKAVEDMNRSKGQIDSLIALCDNTLAEKSSDGSAQ